jgi:quaternary ammonium compound-resistance protein SugE
MTPAPGEAAAPGASTLVPWLWVVFAGGLEVAWAAGLKQSAGFTRFWPTVVTVVLMIASFLALAQGTRHLPIGTAYAVWTGIGAVGAAVVGVVWFKEPVSAVRMLCVALIVAGIVGLKLTSR